MLRTFADVKNSISAGDTVTDVLEGYLTAIKSNEHLNAFLEVFEDSARKQAQIIDQKVKDGSAGRLAGMVIGLKDNLCFKDHKVSAASKILDGFESLYTATAVQRLLDQDAIIIGRLNCDEFAMGSSNENSSFGPVLNSKNINCVPGGSSGGSASAVAAGLCTAALGSDTGGSIRQPASFTGTYGVKPSYGRISRYGLIAYASSFDQIGPFTNDIEDAALLTEIMAGEDVFDATTLSQNVENYSTHLFKIYKNYKVVNILPNSYEFDYQIEYEDKEKVIAYFYQKKFEKIKKFTLTFNLVENVLYDEMHEGFEKENLTLKDKKIYKCRNIQR